METGLLQVTTDLLARAEDGLAALRELHFCLEAQSEADALFDEETRRQVIPLLIQAAQCGSTGIGYVLLAVSPGVRKSARQSLKNSDLRRRLGETEDLVNVAIARFLKNLSNFRGKTEKEIAAFLVKTLKNFVKDQLRLLGRYKEELQSQPIVDADARQPDEDVIQREQIERMKNALRQLSPLDQQIIELRDQDGLSFREIGETVKLSEDAAKQRYYRASKEVREIYKEMNGE